MAFGASMMPETVFQVPSVPSLLATEVSGLEEGLGPWELEKATQCSLVPVLAVPKKSFLFPAYKDVRYSFWIP